jgi:hypothetical protein
MLKRIAVALIGLTLALVAIPPASATKPVTCTLLGCGDDLLEAQYLEGAITQNTEDGQVFEIDKDPSTGAITSINHFGDSALWTGTYLAAESYRYALASKYLADHRVAGDARDFWTAQQADAKPRIDAMVAKFHLLSNISKNWTDTNAPTMNPPAINLGGTVYKGGEPGNLMRACLPTDTPEAYRWSNHEVATSRRVYGPLQWDDGKTYYCEQGTSRDAYAGTFFGLLTAFDLVGSHDKAIADTIRDDIVTMVNFTFKYYWNTPRPNGRISIPIGSNHDGSPCTSINPTLDICGHDFENFDSPLFISTPTARLNLAEAAWHVVHADPGRSDTAVWDAVHAEEIANDLPQLAGEMEIDDAQPNSSYYKFNLNHLTMFDITKEETNPALNLAVRQAFGVMDSTTRDDVNAHFETITYALTGDTSRLNEAVTHLRDWRNYYARIHTIPVTNNSQFCGTTITCVQDDQMDSYFLGQDVTIPGTSTNKRAKDPLAVANRPPTDFLWQRPPWQLDGSESVNHYAPGIDYLLPYWMLRYNTEASTPASDPFPAWPGPVHN